MATTNILTWGFKAKAEKIAKEFRENMHIHPCAPLSAFSLAEHLGIRIYSAIEFITIPTEIDLLCGANGKECEWSALTMQTEAGNRIIIYNPFHSPGRQQSDVMHELAHIICNHERSLTKYDFTIPVGMRHYDPKQEEEAKCLGAILQIARPGLLWAKRRNMTTVDVALHFNASIEMVNYRMNSSGVARQMTFSNRKATQGAKPK